MPDNEKRRTYPSIPASNWWDLRRKFVQAPPRQVTRDFLQTVLGLTEGSANNLLPPLRAVGLIDEAGQPTELAHEWRTDEHYAEVCRTILASVYPQELRDALPPPDPDRQAVERWFMRNTRTGENAAGKMASFYLLLCQADVAAQEQVQAAKSDKAKSRPATAKANNKTPAPPPIAPPTVTPKDSRAGSLALPAVHIDLQIHIAGDAKPEQIEQIFASMARHLYQRP